MRASEGTPVEILRVLDFSAALDNVDSVASLLHLDILSFTDTVPQLPSPSQMLHLVAKAILEHS